LGDKVRVGSQGSQLSTLCPQQGGQRSTVETREVEASHQPRFPAEVRHPLRVPHIVLLSGSDNDLHRAAWLYQAQLSDLPADRFINSINDEHQADTRW